MVGVGCRSLAGVCLNGLLGIGKRYAARVFHNWGKDARGLEGSRSVYWEFSLEKGLPNTLRRWVVPGGLG
jgi:hypothetical protein